MPWQNASLPDGMRWPLRLYVSTWDVDNGVFRALAATAGPGIFGGAANPAAPRIMDDIPPITLP